MTVSNHSNIMYTGDSNGVICQWDTSTNSTIGRVQPISKDDIADDRLHKVHAGTISSMVLMEDDTLLSVGWDDLLRITKGQQEHATPIALPSQPNALSKGTHVVVIMTVDGLLLYTNNHTLSDLIPLEYQPTSICVSKDDTTLYVGNTNGSIYVYALTNDNDNDNAEAVVNNVQLKHTMSNVHRNIAVTALQLSNDNTKLASADTRDICVWDVASYESIIGKGRWCFHTQRIACITWSKDDTILATGSNDDSIYVWSLKKKSKRVHYPFSHRGGISGLEFLKGDFVLQSVGADACVNQWDMTDDILNKFK